MVFNLEILDKVYKTFKNLDRDYAKSKKSRSEFILGKFGGDFDIGSMLILEAVSNFDGTETSEDLDKLSFIKDIFDKLKSSRDIWDQLTDFTFKNNAIAQDYKNLIKESYANGIGVNLCQQSRLRKNSKGIIHYLITGQDTMVALPCDCNVLHAYNTHFGNYIVDKYQGDVRVGSYYELQNANVISEIDKLLLGKVVN